MVGGHHSGAGARSGRTRASDVGRRGLRRGANSLSVCADIDRAFSRPCRGPKLRLLLLARKAMQEYWPGLALDFRSEVAEPLSITLAGGGMNDPSERRNHARIAVESFASELDLPCPPAPDVDGEAYTNPLMVHFAALLAVRGETVEETPDSKLREKILTTWLNRERRHWRDSQATHGLSLSDDEILDVVAAITMAGPTPERLSPCCGRSHHSPTQTLVILSVRLGGWSNS